MPTERADLRATPASWRTRHVQENAIKGKRETHLELLKGEATASTDLAVVLLGHRVDDRAEEARNGARGNTHSLHRRRNNISKRERENGIEIADTHLVLAVDAAAELVSGLVEPGLHIADPVLAKVRVERLVVVLGHCCAVDRRMMR